MLTLPSHAELAVWMAAYRTWVASSKPQPEQFANAVRYADGVVRQRRVVA